MSFVNDLFDSTNNALTTNGANAFRSTKSTVLDFFSRGSALRQANPDVWVRLFKNAWLENPELALKAMFYARDIRGGQGQRAPFRAQLADLARTDPDTVRKNLALVPEYGRWDDLYSLVGTPCEQDAFDLMRKQLLEDIDSETPSLLAKWLKSSNASSKDTKTLAQKTYKAFNMSERTYRKTLSALRARLNVIEAMISRGDWASVEYSSVPSQAMMRYRKAFARNDSDRFTTFINDVNKGEATIKATTLYPYQIVEKCGGGFGWDGRSIDPQVADALWNALPDYVGDDDSSAICVVDTSGSMLGNPINVAVSLGIYFAERSKGPFKDHFISFSMLPELIRVPQGGIVDRVRSVSRADWMTNTNIEAVFNLILDTATRTRADQADIPRKIFIISDMQFDAVGGGTSPSVFRKMKQRFADHGYELPTVVFWNVNGVNNNQPVTMDDQGTLLVSGLSPSLFSQVLGSDIQSPYEMMVEILSSDRYKDLSP